MPELSPTARALRALEILQARSTTTAAELAQRLGVTERAARRYVGILREAGVPVDASRGRYGGYRLGRGTRLAPVAFTEAEALGLVMAVLDAQPGAGVTGTDDLVGSALTKVIRALPESVGRHAAILRENASAAPDRRAERPDPTTTSTLVALVAARRRAGLTYRSESGREWDTEVDPWAVVVRHGRWYLLCHSHRVDAVRTYRIDRVRAVQEREETFEAPGDLDPVAMLEEHLGTGWEFPTRVRFAASHEQVAPWIRPPMGRLETSGTQCVLTGSTSNPQMYVQEWLAAVPFPFHIEGGPELRAAAAELTDRLASSLTTGSDTTTR